MFVVYFLNPVNPVNPVKNKGVIISMKKEKILILRTIPFANFQYFINEISKEYDLNDCDILIQEDLKGKLDLNIDNINYTYIKPGPFNFFRGLKYFSIFKYDKVLIPVNNYDFEYYVNILFFILPIVSKSYIVFYPDLTSDKYSYIKMFMLTFILECISWILLVIVFPFYLIYILYDYIKNLIFKN